MSLPAWVALVAAVLAALGLGVAAGQVAAPRVRRAWRYWERRRMCFHGRPANWEPAGTAGSSYVVCLGMINSGMGKLWECSIAAGGCGKRWT